MRTFSAAAAALAVLLTVGGLAQAPPSEKGGGDETGPYDLVAGWPQNYCGEGFQIGSTAGIWAESPDRVLIFARGCLPVLKREGGGGGGGGDRSSRSAMPPGSTSRRKIRPAILVGITSSPLSTATAR